MSSTCPARRAGHPRLRPQRGRLRGARRPPRSRRLGAGRRAGGRRRRAGQHLRLRRGGQEGLDRHRCSRPPTSRAAGAPRRSSPSAAWPSATASELAEALPEADAVLGFDDYPDDLRPAAEHPRRRAPRPARARATAGALLPLAPADARRRQPRPATSRTCRTASHPASGPRPIAVRLADGPMAPLKLASGCDRRCTFCAIPSFRGAFVSRRPARRPDRGALAGRAGRPRAVPGERELDVVRQGPRRPAAARDAAAASWPRSTASSGSGSAICSRPRCGRA